MAGPIELEKLVRLPVRYPDALIRGDVNVPGIANVRPLVEELAMFVEHLNAAVPAVGDVEAPLVVNGHGVHWRFELTRS